MITKSRGIVLSHIAYGETSIIARIYTRDFGYKSFIVNSVRSAKSKQGMAFFQPFTFLDLVLYLNPSRDLHRISEFKAHKPSMVTNIGKQTMLLFLAEVIDKLLRNDHSENADMFDFIESGLQVFHDKTWLPNFHLQLLLQLTPFLGLTALSGRELFENMGRVVDHTDIEQFLEALIQSPLDQTVEASGDLRTKSLEVLIQYFQHHIDGFGRVHSLEVLAQIFR